MSSKRCGQPTWAMSQMCQACLYAAFAWPYTPYPYPPAPTNNPFVLGEPCTHVQFSLNFPEPERTDNDGQGTGNTDSTGNAFRR